MELRPERSGDIGIALMVGGIALWDIAAPETISHAVHRHLEHPTWRYATTAIILATAAHLLDLFPEGYDPFCWIRLDSE